MPPFGNNNNNNYDDVIDVNVKNLPYCTSQNSVAVGFQSDRDIYFLKKVLLEYMSKSRKELKKLLEDTSDETSSNINENNNRNNEQNKRDQNKRDKEQDKRDKRLFKQNEKLAKSLEKEKESGKLSKEGKAYILNAIDFAFKAYRVAQDSAMHLGNMFMSIEQSGIFLKNGFKEIHEAANRVGMSHGRLAELLKKTSPMLARFNAAGKNGIQTLTKSMASIDASLNLSNDEREAAVEATMNYIPSVRLANMSQQELNVAVNKTAKELKLLAMATGKTIEQIKEEQDIKAKALRVKAYARSHPNEYKALTSVNATDDYIDYIASGGLRITPELMMSMAGPQNEFWRGLANNFIRGNANDSFGIERLGEYINDNYSLLNRSLIYGEKTASNPALYGVQSFSPLNENFAQGGGNYVNLEKVMALGGIGNVSNNTSSGYKTSQLALEKLFEANRERNKLSNNVEWLKGGGVEGVAQVAGIQASIYGTLSGLTDFLVDFFDGTSLGSSITMALYPFYLKYFGDMAGISTVKLIDFLKGKFSSILRFLPKVISAIGPIAAILGAVALSVGVIKGYAMYKEQKERKKEQEKKRGKILARSDNFNHFYEELKKEGKTLDDVDSAWWDKFDFKSWTDADYRRGKRAWLKAKENGLDVNAQEAVTNRMEAYRLSELKDKKEAELNSINDVINNIDRGLNSEISTAEKNRLLESRTRAEKERNRLYEEMRNLLKKIDKNTKDGNDIENKNMALHQTEILNEKLRGNNTTNNL